MGARASRNSNSNSNSNSTNSTNPTPTPTPLAPPQPVSHNLTYYHYGMRIGFRPMLTKTADDIIKQHQMSEQRIGDSYYAPRNCFVFECEADQMLTAEQRQDTKIRLHEQLLKYESVKSIPLLILAYDAQPYSKQSRQDEQSSTASTPTARPSQSVDTETEGGSESTTEVGSSGDSSKSVDGSSCTDFVFDVAGLTSCFGLSGLSRATHIELCHGHASDYDYSRTKEYRHNKGKSNGYQWVSNYIDEKEQEKREQLKAEAAANPSDPIAPSLDANLSTILTKSIADQPSLKTKSSLKVESKSKWKRGFRSVMSVLA